MNRFSSRILRTPWDRPRRRTARRSPGGCGRAAMRRSIRAARGCRACRRPGARGRATLGPGRPRSSCGTPRRRLSGRFASSQCRPRRTAVIPGTSGAWATRSDRRWVGVRAGAAAGARVRTWPRAPPRTSPRPRCAQLEGLMSSAKRSLVPFRRLRGRATGFVRGQG